MTNFRTVQALALGLSLSAAGAAQAAVMVDFSATASSVQVRDFVLFELKLKAEPDIGFGYVEARFGEGSVIIDPGNGDKGTQYFNGGTSVYASMVSAYRTAGQYSASYTITGKLVQTLMLGGQIETDISLSGSLPITVTAPGGNEVTVSEPASLAVLGAGLLGLLGLRRRTRKA